MASTPRATPITEGQLQQLSELLRIESISSDGAHPSELREAADWVAGVIGDAQVLLQYRNPIVDGTIPASVADAPTVIVYGHYDVQSPGDPDLWTSPAFEPTVRDGWLYARGVSDDKGNFYALIRAALDLAAAGRLPVNVRVLSDGEEEIGGGSVVDHLATIEGEFAAAIVFDGHMVDSHRPAITTGLRGLVGFQLHVRSGERELHSGLYGGAAANAVHDLTTILNGGDRQRVRIRRRRRSGQRRGASRMGPSFPRARSCWQKPVHDRATPKPPVRRTNASGRGRR